ncbi:Bdr family repetitive protein [Borreliella burgdorferi]|uniref:Bdr family repetitive protein n=1 Tax=Borreliella burgdorferi TaxID=139 RepID=UPI000D043E41|nr:Bdr family repetitive protein [Borreliella burgdorferi]PRR25905.1 DUF1640 domain-containing protein [Borreliella burgdorferi]PRR29609.1 DUF1640 domain-containing protein [Borreliella burgdorferi]
MNNLAYKTYNIESIKNEFLNKGFSEEAIDFVLLQNDNYNFEVLKEKMNSLEQQIINVEKNFQKDIDSVNTKIDSVEKTLQKDISSLNLKIDGVEKTLQKDISSLDNKIDILKNELNASNRTIQVILIMGITLAPIIYSIFNKYFFN